MHCHLSRHCGGPQTLQRPPAQAFQAFTPAAAQSGSRVRALRPPRLQLLQQQKLQRAQQQRQLACQAAAAPPAPAANRSSILDLPPLPPPLSDPRDAILFADIDLPLYDPSAKQTFDVVVAGSGPAGLAVAERVSKAGFSVLLVDPNPKVGVV